MLRGPGRTLDRSQRSVLAWDLPTRLFKWSLVACVFLAWATDKFGEDEPYLHKWVGYAVLVLIVFRLLWGFVGGSTARLSAFVTWPWTAVRFFIKQLRGSSLPFLGHTPIAGWMILALMSVLAVEGTLGLFAADPDRLIIEGPLTDMVSDETIHAASSLHRLGFDLILVLAGMHILANLIYDVFKRKGYIKAMITGRKSAGDYVDFAEATPGSVWKALICLAAAATIVFGGIFALGGHPFR